jgi:adenosylcobinamide-GDP ribazoletransferase
MSIIRPYLIAMQFLTRFPMPTIAAPAPEEAGRSVLFYPVVGLLLGAVLASAAILLPAEPALVAAALILAIWTAATGGLHLDGLADSADAWACGGEAERRLAVMKDPNCGPAAVSAVVMVLLLKFAALAALLAYGNRGALVLAPMLGRTAAVAVFLTTPYVRPGGLGAAMAAHLPVNAGWAVITLAALVALVTGHGALALVAALAVLMLRYLMMHHLGGATGDTIGASVELTEAAVLTAAVFNG